MKTGLTLQILGLSCLLCACASNKENQVTQTNEAPRPELRWVATLAGTDPSDAPLMRLDLLRKENNEEKSIAQGTCIGNTMLVNESGSATTMRCNWDNGGGDLGAFVEDGEIKINYRQIDAKTGTGEWTPVTTIKQ